MKRLSNRQEQVMALIWKYGPMTVNKLIHLIDENLHFNTISTVVRELERNGYLGHDNEFRPFVYYPLISKDEYIDQMIEAISHRFFNNDRSQFAETIQR